MHHPPTHPPTRTPAHPDCSSAFTKNFNVLFLSDGTATATKQLHAASLLNLGYGFARVLTCAEAAAAVQEAAEAPAQDASDS